ncbi:MAG: GNAT family N-acetyltransferase [Actinomycetaceae bacterium]
MKEHVLVSGQVPTVRDDAERERYVAEIAGHVPLGRIDYHRREHMVSLRHTEVDPDRSVPGLARLLVDGALADIRARGLRVLPYCPYVRTVIDENRDRYLDLVPRSMWERFDLAPAEEADQPAARATAKTRRNGMTTPAAEDG